MTHNLLLCCEQSLEERHEVTHVAEERTRRTAEVERAGPKMGWPIFALRLQARRATHRSVKFIRWLRHAIRERLAEPAAVVRSATVYAVL